MFKKILIIILIATNMLWLAVLAIILSVKIPAHHTYIRLEQTQIVYRIADSTIEASQYQRMTARIGARLPNKPRKPNALRIVKIGG